MYWQKSGVDSLAASVIPTVLDQSMRGERAYDIYSLLLKERIVFLGQEVDDQIANLLVAEILYLEGQDPERDIHLYINSPGGLAYAGWPSTTSCSTFSARCRLSALGWQCRPRLWISAAAPRASGWRCPAPRS